MQEKQHNFPQFSKQVTLFPVINILDRHKRKKMCTQSDRSFQDYGRREKKFAMKIVMEIEEVFEINQNDRFYVWENSLSFQIHGV